MISAAQRWRDGLAAWAVPDDILAAAPESPWGFSVAGFADRAERQRRQPTPAHELALAVLLDGGRVLDVGCGGGAASLPLVPPATHLTGFDSSAGMLAAFRDAAEAAGATVDTIEGTWPDDAPGVADASHDVVVAQDVLYNVPDAHGFVRACARVAARRVVVVLPTVHPMTWTTPYWQRLHDLSRPTTPTVDDAEAVVVEAGMHPKRVTWTEPTLWAHAPRDEAVAMVRRRLCLPSDSDSEVRAVLEEIPPPVQREAVALWWDV